MDNYKDNIIYVFDERVMDNYKDNIIYVFDDQRTMKSSAFIIARRTLFDIS